MKCVIPGVNIKVFGRAVHSLSKIGDELYVEPLEQGFALRTVNSTRSAYAYMLFSPSFFTHYDDGSALLKSNDSEDEGLRCKVNMKSMLTVFKSLSSIERSVERCKITLNTPEARLVFQLYCRHGIVKTHNLAFIECETLQAVFSKDLTPNRLTAHPKLLCDAVINFQNNQEEVTLIAKPDKISLKNYVDDEPDPKKVVLTEMHLDPNEFDNCQLGVDTEITFCLKELRAILGFAEVISLPINMHFERAGRPIVISIDSDKTFEANFVLATLADCENQTTHTQSVSQNTSKHRMKSQSKQKRSNNSRVKSTAPSTSDRSNGFGNNTKNKRPAPSFDEEFEDDFDEMICNDPTVDQLSRVEHQNIPNKNTTASRSTHPVTVPNISHTRQSNTPPLQSSSERADSPVIPMQCETAKISFPAETLNQSEMQDLDEDLDDTIPGTPPSKKFRSMIFGLSQSQDSQQSKNKPLQNVQVLAEDTDEDD
ncbi:hypothetical protein SNE40_003046 [Patella caerulea]|uniref:Cell cycle checkpoint control protein n=1 Tax=Patella caerulea TaxID=87958 RepID=A0AAN8Q852_PATCE